MCAAVKTIQIYECLFKVNFWAKHWHTSLHPSHSFPNLCSFSSFYWLVRFNSTNITYSNHLEIISNEFNMHSIRCCFFSISVSCPHQFAEAFKLPVFLRSVHIKWATNLLNAEKYRSSCHSLHVELYNVKFTCTDGTAGACCFFHVDRILRTEESMKENRCEERRKLNVEALTQA